jgi:integrase/recombinase XerD
MRRRAEQSGVAAVHHSQIKTKWENLTKWMTLHNYKDFSESIGFQYCDETLGTHIFVIRLTHSEKIRLRAVRMLTSYQKDGDFEFRTPRIERIFYDDTGNDMCLYLSYLRNVQHLSESTLRNKEQYLYEFFCYLKKHSLTLDNLCVEVMEDFFGSMGYSLASRHNCGSILRIYFRYAHDNGNTDKDNSVFVLDDNYNRHCKIPTTYEEDEIRRIIASVERSSTTGKRETLDTIFPKRNDGPSIGTYLLVGALSRCLKPVSKRGTPEWYRKTMLPRLAN